MTLHWIDYVIILILTLSVLTGLIRGFVRELIALCVWVTAIWVGYTYAPKVSPLLISYSHDPTPRIAISFIGLLLATLLAGSLLSGILSFILNRSPLKGTDRLLGMGFGLVRGVFIIALLIGIINLTSLAKDTEFKDSHLYARFKPMSIWIFNLMPNALHQVRVLPLPKTAPEATEPNKQEHSTSTNDLDSI
ncbi:MAG: CvpA family protein [Gammaproteobacteria bacterium]|nr:CvpA family protein [Gammaproteobacteria bacterium]MCH9764170.1 CvpA family protein [Gammaproteobacteria bacterium]